MFEERLTARLDARLKYVIDVVTTAADNFGAALARLERDLSEVRSEMREQTRQTSLMLASHENRITALERKPRTPRRRSVMHSGTLTIYGAM